MWKNAASFYMLMGVTFMVMVSAGGSIDPNAGTSLMSGHVTLRGLLLQDRKASLDPVQQSELSLAHPGAR